MLLAHLRRSGRLSVRRWGYRRWFGTQNPHHQQGVPAVRVLGPTIFCLSLAGTFYFGFAAYDVYRDVQTLQRSSPGKPVSYDQIDSTKPQSRRRDSHDQSTLRGTPVSILQNLASDQKVIVSLIGLNISLYAACRVIPGTDLHFAHIPVDGRNYTFLTAMFGHVGLLHLGLNMYALFNFAPPVAASNTFQRNGPHLAAFYLSAGVLANLAYHLTSPWRAFRIPWPRQMSPAMGASGAIEAMLAAFALTYPEARIGIIFVPGFSVSAFEGLGFLALFETYGLLVGFKSLAFGHGAHLGGLAVGAAYVYLDGKHRVWVPARKLAFRTMRRVGLF